MSMLNKKTIEDINVAGKKVLVRCDFNVPLQDGVITDENRLVGALPTIKYLIAQGAKVILCSHLGKPKGEPKPELSLAPVAKRLSAKEANSLEKFSSFLVSSFLYLVFSNKTTSPSFMFETAAFHFHQQH